MDTNTEIEPRLTAARARSPKRTLAVLQPGYLPWLGFFDQMARADVFVIYDDVQYDKNGWRNRNRIKSPTGPHWLTVPVRVELGQKINQVQIDYKQKWGRKQVETIKQFYKKAPYLDEYLPALETLLQPEYPSIADLDFAVLSAMKQWLAIPAQVVRSSELGIGGDRNERLLNFCKHFDAELYLSGNAAQCYLDVGLFAENSVEVEWQDYVHPSYQQLHGEFFPSLSTLDLLLNVGPDSRQFFDRHP